MKCDATDCKNEATKRIEFFVHSKTSKEPAKALPLLYACDACATQEAANDLLIDNIKGRRQIEDQFEAQGLERPDWTRSKAEWVEYND